MWLLSVEITPLTRASQVLPIRLITQIPWSSKQQVAGMNIYEAHVPAYIEKNGVNSYSAVYGTGSQRILGISNESWCRLH